MKRFTLVFLATLLLPATGMCTEWGTITGTVVLDGEVPDPVLLIRKGAAKYENGEVIQDPEVCAATDVFAKDLVIDKKTKGIANVFVYQAVIKVPPTVTVDHKNCVIVPHTLVLQAGQTVEMINSDPIAHNTHANVFKDQSRSSMVPRKTTRGRGVLFPFTERESVPIRVNCDIHRSVKAYWLVMDHPYAAVTDAKGKFTIKNLPVGEHEFRVWHERPGYVYMREGTKDRLKLTVKAGENNLKPITVKLSQLQSY